MKNAYSNTDNILLKPKKERNSKGNKNMQKKKKKKKNWSTLLSINQYLSKNYWKRNDLWNWRSSKKKKNKRKHNTKLSVREFVLYVYYWSFIRINMTQYCISLHLNTTCYRRCDWSVFMNNRMCCSCMAEYSESETSRRHGAEDRHE